MAKGIVYILTNPCLKGWVKIGMTERNDIEQRIRELNAPPNIPLAFRCYAVYEVDEPLSVETRIHRLIDLVDDTLHAREEQSNGRIREREFFRISPETAYNILREIAILRNDEDKLKKYAPTEEQAQEEEIAEGTTRRKNNSFQLLGIPVGETVTFLYDETISVIVADNKNLVAYDGERHTVSALARKFLMEKHSWSKNRSVNGWLYFVKDGITLSERRERIESRCIDE